MAELTVETPDGRQLEVFVAGPDDGLALITHHGTPSSGMLYAPRVAEAVKRGLRTVGWSRPGYGGSDRREGRTIAECVSDVAVIADALGVDRFYTLGGSGGGPHSLATAALLPDRVLAAASIAGVVPWHADDIDWLEGMGQENIDEFGAALKGGDTLRDLLEEHRAQAVKATPEAIVTMLGSLLSDVDKAAVNDELGEFLAAETAHALASGVDGWFDDDIAFTTPWGFAVDAIEVPVSVWHGSQDRFVPYSHGEWLAKHVKGASVHLLPDEGHLSIAEAMYGDVLDELLALAR